MIDYTCSKHPFPSDLVTQKVKASACPAYECEEVTLAEDLKATLVTSDRQVLAEFPALTLSLKAFAGGAQQRRGSD